MPPTLDTVVDNLPPEDFIVLGNNWRKEVSVVPNEAFEGAADILDEAATRAVELFLKGEYETENPDNPVGFGPVLVVRHIKTNRNWSLPAPKILANAGAYKDAKDVQDIIDRNRS